MKRDPTLNYLSNEKDDALTMESNIEKKSNASSSLHLDGMGLGGVLLSDRSSFGPFGGLVHIEAFIIPSSLCEDTYPLLE